MPTGAAIITAMRFPDGTLLNRAAISILANRSFVLNKISAFLFNTVYLLNKKGKLYNAPMLDWEEH